MTVTRDDANSASMDQSFVLEGGLSTSLAVALGAVLVIEGAVLHLWIAPRSQLWAWAITAVNVVTLVWLWREVRAQSRSALCVGATDVDVVVGNRLRCRIPRTAIAAVERATWRSIPDVAPSDYVNAAKPLEPNVMLVLREPAEATLPLGITRRVSRVGVRARDAEALVRTLGV